MSLSSTTQASSTIALRQIKSLLDTLSITLKSEVLLDRQAELQKVLFEIEEIICSCFGLRQSPELLHKLIAKWMKVYLATENEIEKAEKERETIQTERDIVESFWVRN
jgi:hypothetical protein